MAPYILYNIYLKTKVVYKKLQNWQKHVYIDRYGFCLLYLLVLEHNFLNASAVLYTYMCDVFDL